jgi:hypothetical protein
MIANCCVNIFLLRYGWFSLVELGAGVSEISLTHFEDCMIPEVIQVKSPSGDKACVQKDGTLLSNCTHEQYPCSSMLLHMTRSSTGKNSELPDQLANVPPSQFGSQKQVQVPVTQASEVIFSVSCILLSTKCFYGRSSFLLL